MLRDPLIHFLAAGAVLFAITVWRGGEPEPERILIPEERIGAVIRRATLLEGRPPTAEELEALVEPVIREEVWYREALALGLDQNDDEVRTRLVEKMRYLSENLADPEPPTEAELRAWYDADPSRFEIPELATFDQVYFSPDERGTAIGADVQTALAALNGGADPNEFGDRTPLQQRLSDAAPDRVRILFGPALTNAVFRGVQDRWLGPFESDFGLHLVRVVERSPARIPPFSEIGEQVSQVYAEQMRLAANEAAYQEMLRNYDVVVEWPAVTE